MNDLPAMTAAHVRALYLADAADYDDRQLLREILAVIKGLADGSLRLEVA